MAAPSSGTNIDIAIKVQGGPEATKAAQQVGDSIDQMGDKVDKGAKKFETAFSRMDRTAKMPLTNTNKAVGETVKQTGVLSTVGSRNISQFGSAFEKGLGGAPQITSKFSESIDKTNKSSSSLVSTGRQLGSSMTSLVGSFAAVGGSAIALFEAYDSVGDAQLNVDKASTRLANQQRILTNLQNDLTAATARYGAGSQQVAEIQARLEVQQQKVAIATGDLANAEENLAITQTHFAKEIIPLTIAMFGSLTTIVAQGRETFAAFGKGLGSLRTALSQTDKAMKFFSLSNPFFLALTIGGAIVGAFATNLFGFRDAINSVGEAIGNAIPFLKPFLTMLGDFGNWLGSAFGGGVDEAEKFTDEFGNTMNEAGDVLNTFGEKVELEGAHMVSRMKTMADDFIKEGQRMKKEADALMTIQVEDPLSTVEGRPLRSLGSPGAEFADVLNQRVGEGSKTIQQYVGDVNILGDALNGWKLAEDRVTESVTANGGSITEVNAILDIFRGLGVEVVESYESMATEIDKVADSNIEYGKSVLDSANATQEQINKEALHKLAIADVSTQLQGLTSEHNKLSAVLGDTVAIQATANAGFKTYENSVLKASQALIFQKGYLDAYAEGLKMQVVQTQLFVKGMYDQRQAFLDTQAATITLQGKLSELQAWYATGAASVIAYNEAFVKQQIEIEESKTQLDAIRGSYDALAESMARGEAQSIAYTRGYEEQRSAIQNTTLELNAQQGALLANNEAIKDGTLLHQAGARARLEYLQSVIDSITEIETLSTTLEEYNKALDRGIPQALAYAKAQYETQLATAKVKEEFAALRGEGDVLRKNLTDVAYMTDVMNVSFQKGYNDISKWVSSIQEANSQSSGMRQRLFEIGSGFGGIPLPIAHSVQAMKDWIEVSLGMPEAVDKGLKSAIDKAKGSIDSLTEAWQKGSNLSGKEIEKILGVNLPKEVDQEINMHFKFKANENEMRQGMTNLVGLMGEMGSNLSDKSAKEIVDSMQRGLDQRLKDGTISQSFHTYFSDMLAKMPKPSDTAAFSEWIAHFDQLNTAIESGNPEMIAAVIDAMVKDTTRVTASAQAIKSYAEAVNQTQKAIDDYNKNTPGLFKNAQAGGNDWYKKLTGAEGIDKSTYTIGDQNIDNTPPAEPDTSGIDKAMEKLNAYNLAVSAMITTTQEAVSQANAEFAKLNPVQPTFATNMVTMTSNLSKLPAGIAEMITKANLEFAKLGEPLMTTVATTFSTFQAALGRMPGWISTNVVSPTVRAFNTMAQQLQSGPFTKIQNDAAVAFQAVTNIAQSEARKLSTAFDTAVANVIAQFGALQNAATQVMEAIIRAASNAQQAVRNLAGEINGLQDKTVTITTVHVDRYETQYAAAGFGPTVVDHPTHILVGESGPEFVNVTPLNSTGGKNLNANDRLNLFNDPGRQRINPAPIMLANGTPGMPGSPGMPAGVFTTSGTSNINSGSVPAVSSTTYDMRLLFVGLNKLITDAVPVEIIRSNVGLGGGGSSSSGGGSSSGGIGSSTGNSQSSMIVSPGSIINQGNNVNISNDSNSNNNVAPNGQIIQGPGSSGTLADNANVGTSPNAAGLNITGSGGNYYYQNQNGNVNTNIGSNTSGNTGTGVGSNTNPQGAINSGGMVVDGKNALVMMNGMIVDGKRGVVIMNGQGLGGLGGLGGLVNGPGAGMGPIYPINARTGSSVEPMRGPFRSGQDNMTGIYDIGKPNPYQDYGVYSGNGGSTIGLPGLPGGLGSIFEFINKLLGQIFSGLKLNQNFNLQIDSDFVGRSMFNKVTTTLATIQR